MTNTAICFWHNNKNDNGFAISNDKKNLTDFNLGEQNEDYKLNS